MLATFNWDTVIRFLNITLIDIALSGDNAIVIGMAAASLAPGRRKWAIAIGGGLAIILRIVLTSIATFLMLIPYLSVAGGLILVWVVYKLLRLDTGAAGPEEDKKKASNFRQAILLILMADFMMSLDNVIAVAGSAHGSVFLLVAGLLISMPLLMITGGFISMLIDKARWIIYLGAFAISFTAARMIFEDGAMEARFHFAKALVYGASAAAGVAIPAACVLIGKWRAKRQEAR